MKKVSLIGFGSWGIALACLLEKNGHAVKAWEYDSQMVKELNREREHKKFLPGVKIPESILINDNVDEVCRDAEVFVMAIPSSAISKALPQFKPYFTKDAIITSVSKGFEEKTKKRISEYLGSIAPNSPIVVLTGPSHAEEVSRGLPTTVVSASSNTKAAEEIAETFSNSTFRVYTTNDVIGVELGGALKNVIALAAGMSDGLGFGDNTKAALMSRGIAEIARLGVKMGAKESTFSGLSGIGDLIVTCTSIHSRNYRAGKMLAEGRSVSEVISSVSMVVEGIHTAKTALNLANENGVSMPIVEEINKVLFDGKGTRQAVVDLMLRGRGSE